MSTSETIETTDPADTESVEAEHEKHQWLTFELRYRHEAFLTADEDGVLRTDRDKVESVLADMVWQTSQGNSAGVLMTPTGSHVASWATCENSAAGPDIAAKYGEQSLTLSSLMAQAETLGELFIRVLLYEDGIEYIERMLVALKKANTGNMAAMALLPAGDFTTSRLLDPTASDSELLPALSAALMLADQGLKLLGLSLNTKVKDVFGGLSGETAVAPASSDADEAKL